MSDEAKKQSKAIAASKSYLALLNGQRFVSNFQLANQNYPTIDKRADATNLCLILAITYFLAYIPATGANNSPLNKNII